MRKLFATFFATIVLSFCSQAQIVINEILFNIPSTGENEEFIEIHNAGTVPVNMMNYTIKESSVVHTFGNISIAAGGYFVLARDSAAFHTSFGFAADAIGPLGLSNAGEDIMIYDASGALIDSVDYESSSPWPGNAAQGKAYQLCDPLTDNNVGSNWGDNSIATGVNGQTGSDSLYCTPGAMNICDVVVPPPPPTYPVYTFSQVNAVNSNGIADSANITCELRGIAHCIDLKIGTGVEFAFANSNNMAGIHVFTFLNIDNYSVLEGDSLHILGTISQFNGLLQFIPDSIGVISQGNATAMPWVVNTPSEMTENRLITLNGVHIVDTSAWTGTGSGFNVLVTDGSADTSVVRIDDATDAYSLPVPIGTFNITGWGGQFDSSDPRTSGYQLLPCSMSDIVVGYTELDANSSQITIFPNPASTLLNVHSDIDIQSILIHNTLGQEIISHNNMNTNITQVNTSNLENGIYIISVISDKKIMTQQFQVVK